MHAEEPPGAAEMGIAATAAGADAARDEGVADEIFADDVAVDAGAGIDDAAAELVSHDEGRGAARAAVLDAFQFAAAEAAGGDIEEDFAGGGCGIGEIADFKDVKIRVE